MKKQKNFYTELLESDWLGRTKDDYTHTRKDDGMGWEATLTKGDAFSSYLLNTGTSKLDMPRQVMLSKQACNIILRRMNTEKLKLKLRFNSAPEFKAWTGGGLVMASLEPLKSKLKFDTFNHRLDPIIGAVVHEMCHVLYTDKRYENYVLSFKGEERRVKGAIMNIIEDERIEKKMGEAFGGYVNYLGKMKDYLFGALFQHKMQTGMEGMEPIVMMFRTFIYMVRYPKSLLELEVMKYENELRQIQAALNPYPEDVTEVIAATDKIYDVFKKFMAPPAQPKAKAQTEDEQGEGEQGTGSEGGGKGKPSKQEQDKEEDKDSEAAEGGDDEETENKSDDDKNDSDPKDAVNKEGEEEEETDSDSEGGENEDAEKEGDEDDEDEDGGNDGDDADDDEEAEDEDADGGAGGGDDEPEQDAKLEDKLNELLEALGVALSMDKKDQKTEAKQLGVAEELLEMMNSMDNEMLDKFNSSTHKYPQTQNLQGSALPVIWIKPEELDLERNNYDEALRAVAPYGATLRAKLQKLNRAHEVTYKGLAEGDFDEDMLVDAMTGAKNVYKEDTRVVNPGSVVGLLIDESGSMGEDGKWERALQIAVMFERALDGVNNTDFYCYGHTTCRVNHLTWAVTRMHTYFEGRKKGNRKNLGKIYNYGANSDGQALLETVCKMRETVPMEKTIILFMVSDGEPSGAVPTGYTGEDYVRKVVTLVQNTMNTVVIHIAIEDGIPSEDMYDHYVKFTNFNTLVTDMGTLLNKIVAKYQKAIQINL